MVFSKGHCFDGLSSRYPIVRIWAAWFHQDGSCHWNKESRNRNRIPDGSVKILDGGRGATCPHKRWHNQPLETCLLWLSLQDLAPPYPGEIKRFFQPAHVWGSNLSARRHGTPSTLDWPNKNWLTASLPLPSYQYGAYVYQGNQSNQGPDIPDHR